METLQHFLAYAGEFEKTLADDQWTRLRPFFAADAVYEVQADAFGCRLVGPEAIFAGMKKSLDNFDRKFTSRDLAVTDGPAIDGDEIRLGWQVTYHREGLPPYVLRGRSLARFADGVITYLSDLYDDRVAPELAAWMAKTGVALDPSYT